MHRRQMLTGGAGLVGMSALMPMLASAQGAMAATAAGASGGFDPADPVQNAEVLARMNLGIGPSTNYGWFKGRVFAVFGDEQVIQPLFDLEGFGANHMVSLGDARYQSLHREVGYYKDLRTGAILESWKNPFIDEVVSVSHIHNDPVNSVIGPTIEAKLGEGMVTKFPLALPWTMMGDLAMTSFDVNTRWKNVLDPKEWPRESSGQEYVRVSEYLQFFAQRADLENWRSLERIPTHGSLATARHLGALDADGQPAGASVLPQPHQGAHLGRSTAGRHPRLYRKEFPDLHAGARKMDRAQRHQL